MLHCMSSSLDSKHVYPPLTDAGHSCQLEHPFQGTIWQPAGRPLLRAVLCGVSSKKPFALQLMPCASYERCNLLLHIKYWHLVLDMVSLSHATHAVLMSHVMHAVLNHLLPSATRSCVFCIVCAAHCMDAATSCYTLHAVHLVLHQNLSFAFIRCTAETTWRLDTVSLSHAVHAVLAIF